MVINKVCSNRCAVLYVSFGILFFSINNTVGQVSSKLNNHLLVAVPDQILIINPDNLNAQQYTTSISAVSIDYDFKRNSLVWSDIKTKQVYILPDDCNEANVLVANKYKWSPFSISVDFINDNLYVVDTFTDTVQIFNRKDVTKYGILTGSSLWKIKTIVLDPYEGYLFILDQYQIVRTDLDGSNMKVIYFELHNEDRNNKESPIYIGNIALDLKTKRLYWINVKTRIIESVDYDGKNKIIHYKDQNRLQLTYSLALVNNDLYWVDIISQKLFNFNLSNGKVGVIAEKLYSLFMKSIVCPVLEISSRPCDIDNGQCQHICLSSGSNEENVKCSCYIGYQLDLDEKSCIVSTEFILFKQGKLLRGKSLRNDGYLATDVINPAQFEVGSLIGLDFDAEDGLIFYSSIQPNDQIHQVRLETGEKKTLIPDILSNSVGKIAYDWVTKNLYYFTHYYSNMITLSVVNINNPTYSKIVIEDVKGIIRGIAIHPNQGYIYYILTFESTSKINRINTDGSGLKIFTNLGNLHRIEDIAVDYIYNRIYFTELKQEENNRRTIQIRHSNLDGDDIQKLIEIESFEGNIASMAINLDCLYLNTGSKLYRLNITNPQPIIIVEDREMSKSLSHIKVFNRTVQTTATAHPCTNNAHDCQKFCFAILDLNNSLKSVCGCPYGEKLDEDGKSCVDNSKEEPPFLPCTETDLTCKKFNLFQ